MNRRTAALCCAAVLILAAGCAAHRPGAAPQPRIAHHPAAPVSPVAPPSSLPPAPSATPTVSARLDTTASALGTEGRGVFADTYASLALDPPGSRVLLYVTDAGRGRALLAAARGAHPEIADVDVQVIVCGYTKKDADAAMTRILAHRFAFPVYSAGFAVDGSGVTVDSSADGAASAEFARAVQAAAGSVHTTVVPGSPVIATALTG